MNKTLDGYGSTSNETTDQAPSPPRCHQLPPFSTKERKEQAKGLGQVASRDRQGATVPSKPSGGQRRKGNRLLPDELPRHQLHRSW